MKQEDKTDECPVSADSALEAALGSYIAACGCSEDTQPALCSLLTYKNGCPIRELMERTQFSPRQSLESVLREQVRVLERDLSIARRALLELTGERNIKPPERDRPPTSGGPFRRAGSMWEAAKFALEDTGHPLQVQELCDLLGRYGRPAGGENPAWNLSNILSGKRGIFQSLHWRRQKSWWLAGIEVPEE